MNTERRVLLAALAATSLLAGCATPPAAVDPQVRSALAPTGRLRVALYPGTPTSILPDAPGGPRGVGHDLGRALAQRLGVPFAPVVYPRNAEVLEAIKTGQADVAFTNASASRARDMDFGPAYLEIALGYLAAPGSALASLADIDRPGVRVGVTAGSSSEGVLGRDLKQATLVRTTTVGDGARLLAARGIDAYATNKATLWEMANEVSGARMLDGAWGVERHSIAIPKGRDAGMPFIRAFAEQVRADGTVDGAVRRAGLRGTMAEEKR